MFNPGDIVIGIYNNEKAQVSFVQNNEYMFVKYVAKFVKGGFSTHSEMVLIKNFRLA